MHRLYAKAIPFYIRDLSICEFWYSWASWNQSPVDTQGQLYMSCFLFFFKYKFIYLLGCVGSSLLCAGFSLVAASGGYSSLQCVGFSLWWLLLLWNTGSRAQAQQLWCTGLVALWHVGSSQSRDRTRYSCIDRRILNHCATKGSPLYVMLNEACLFTFSSLLSCQNVGLKFFQTFKNI